MFESAELGHKISKEVWKKEIPVLREELLDAQLDLFQAKKFPVIILVAGVDCAGKGETVNLLNEWMDPRHIETHALRELTDEELALIEQSKEDFRQGRTLTDAEYRADIAAFMTGLKARHAAKP